MHVSDSRSIDFYEAVHIIVVPVHTAKTYWGTGGVAPLFLLSALMDWVVSVTSRPFYPPGNGLPLPIE